MNITDALIFTLFICVILSAINIWILLDSNKKLIKHNQELINQNIELRKLTNQLFKKKDRKRSRKTFIYKVR